MTAELVSVEGLLKALKQRHREHLLEIRDLNSRVFGLEEAITIIEGMPRVDAAKDTKAQRDK